ncbi:MAG: hypothetical protein ACXAE3_16560, partial [Candidatus Kariarchaeaceae archaeon]
KDFSGAHDGIENDFPENYRKIIPPFLSQMKNLKNVFLSSVESFETGLFVVPGTQISIDFDYES